MGDLKDHRAIWLKGGLFLVLGFLCAALLIIRLQSINATILLVLCVWSFCRAYYFAFYVIQHYVDPSYRFAGLTDFARYALGLRRPNAEK